MTKTDEIYETTSPYNNPYQRFDKFPRWLFVCSAGLLRSATGANLYAQRGINTRNAGTHSYALIPLSANLIAWADRIIFVNKENHRTALARFEEGEFWINDKLKEATVLDIPDNYEYNDERLIAEFDKQLT